MELNLYAPKGFWSATEKEKEENCNGCGSELDLSGKLVPNTMYGLDVRPACCPHDWGYKFGKTHADKVFTDCMFLYNMVALILNAGGWLTIPRLLRATKYFIAVVKYGDKSFWDGKIKNEKNKITFKGEFRKIKGVER